MRNLPLMRPLGWTRACLLLFTWCSISCHRPSQALVHFGRTIGNHHRFRHHGFSSSSSSASASSLRILTRIRGMGSFSQLLSKEPPCCRRKSTALVTDYSNLFSSGSTHTSHRDHNHSNDNHTTTTANTTNHQRDNNDPEELYWQRYAKLYQQVQILQRQLHANETYYLTQLQHEQQQLQRQVDQHNATLRAEQDRIQSQMEAYQAQLMAHDVPRRLAIQRCHHNLTQQLQQQSDELDQTRQESARISQELFEWQCDMIRWKVPLETLQDQVATEQSWRRANAAEFAATLAQWHTDGPQHLAQLQRDARRNRTALARPYHDRLRAAESTARRLRHDIRRHRRETVPRCDERIRQLEEQQRQRQQQSSSSSLRRVSWKLVRLVVQRWYRTILRPLWRLTWWILIHWVWKPVIRMVQQQQQRQGQERQVGGSSSSSPPSSSQQPA